MVLLLGGAGKERGNSGREEECCWAEELTSQADS